MFFFLYLTRRYTYFYVNFYLGVGGIPTGSNNDDITLTSCEIIGSAEEMPEPMPIVWGTQVL